TAAAAGPELRGALARRRVGRLEAPAVARRDERERRRRRRRKAVREQVDEFDERVAPRRTEARGEIRNRSLGQEAREAVERRVADAPRGARVRAARPRADDQIVFVEMR